MAFNRRSLAKLFFLLLLVLLIAIPAARLAAASQPTVDRAGGPRDLVEVTLYAGAAPSRGQTTELTLEAKPFADVPDLIVQWQVPDGATLIGDVEEVFGPVSAGQTVASTRQVRFDSEGTYKVAGAAVLDYGPDAQYGASGVVFYTINPLLSAVSDMDPDAKSPMRTIMPTEIISSTDGMAPNAATGDPCFTIRGTITRTERSPQPGGYVTSTGVPVHNAKVEIREEDLVFDDGYGSILTNSSGFFQKSFCDDDGLFDDELEIYIRLHAETWESGQLVAEIIDSSWIDEVYEYDSWVVTSEGGTHTFNVALNNNQSAVFNIADAVLDAWRFWNNSGGEAGGDAIFDEEGEVHWEPGYGDDGSYYMSFWGEMTIADDPSDPDQWDDSVIIHEWGHMADDIYSCDDNPGGDHFINRLVGDPELSWGEGYPNYYQSAVRAATGQPAASRYIDINGTGTGGINVNIEPTQASGLVSVLYEMAIAGALWDLRDTANDGQDTVSFGHSVIQDVYTSSTFEDIAYGFFDDDCDFDAFAKAWRSRGNPANGATAATILQNTGYTLPPPSLNTQTVNSSAAVTAQGPTDGIWWNQLTYVVDNSKSMTGAKFNAIKTVLEEAINDLGTEPEGTEFTLESFNNSSFDNGQIFAGQFFPNRLTPAINSFNTSGAADNSCATWSLFHLNQALQEQQGGHAWLFTDGDTVQYPSVENMKQALNEREIKASVALMGICSTLAAQTADPSPAQQQMLDAAAAAGVDAAAMQARAQIELSGALQRYLGLAANEPPGGIVPYLLTAINSGGNFLFVDPSQTANAADILRAQITHSAGAGSWSDYVSDSATYRWDELPSWEFQWIDASGSGTDHGSPPHSSPVTVNLPQNFPYYGNNFFGWARVYEDGYMTLGNFFGAQSSNSTLPNPAQPNNALYPYWDDLDDTIICRQSPDAPEGCGLNGKIYSKQEAPWFAIEHKNYYASGQAGKYMDFQTQFNLESGEIRYLYGDLAGVGAPSATIGLENSSGSSGVQVSYNDKNGAASNMGYKFTPAPPQPTKVYPAMVDAHMDGIAFLLTGYSGTFEDLVVKYPNGSQVNCNDTNNVLCLDLGLVQYVQADVDGRYGEWQAIVDAGSSGEGTFSFFSMGASAITAHTTGSRSLSTAVNPGIIVDLGTVIDSTVIGGRFVQPNNEPFGGAFDLFDDGAHNDGRAADGIFGSDPYTPGGAGTAYLRVFGQHEGINFERSDPVPFSFQPVKLQSSGDTPNFGAATELQFVLTNLDNVKHDYFLTSSLPLNWGIDGIFGTWTLNPGQSKTITAFVTMDTGATNNHPSGTAGEVVLTAVEAEEGIMTDTASATITRHRPPAEIEIHNGNFYIRPGGDKAQLEFFVVDAQNTAVADGTEVNLTATLGTINPAVGQTVGGYFTAEFSSGNSPGTAVITAKTSDSVMALNALISATTEIDIGEAKANSITLKVDEEALPPGGSTQLTAVVTDRYDYPVAGQKVRIGVEGDGQSGTVGNNKEFITGTTNANGRVLTTFIAEEIGQIGVRAELLVQDGGQQRVVHEDRKLIHISGGVYLPVVSSQ